MVQRQKERNHIIFLPCPGVNQSGDLGGNIAMGRDHTFGLAGGAAGENDHGFSLSRQLWQRAYCSHEVIIHPQQFNR